MQICESEYRRKLTGRPDRCQPSDRHCRFMRVERRVQNRVIIRALTCPKTIAGHVVSGSPDPVLDPTEGLLFAF